MPALCRRRNRSRRALTCQWCRSEKTRDLARSNIRVRSGAEAAVDPENLVRSFSTSTFGLLRGGLRYRTTVPYSSRTATCSEGPRGQPTRGSWTTRPRVLASGARRWTGGRAWWVARGWAGWADPQHVAIGSRAKPLHLVVLGLTRPTRSRYRSCLAHRCQEFRIDRSDNPIRVPNRSRRSASNGTARWQIGRRENEARAATRDDRQGD